MCVCVRVVRSVQTTGFCRCIPHTSFETLHVVQCSNSVISRVVCVCVWWDDAVPYTMHVDDKNNVASR